MTIYIIYFFFIPHVHQTLYILLFIIPDYFMISLAFLFICPDTDSTTPVQANVPKPTTYLVLVQKSESIDREENRTQVEI